MARRPAVDERQTDFFGAPAPELPSPHAHPVRQARPKQSARRWLSSPDGEEARGGDDLDALASRLSPPELDELAAALPDDALAHLTLAAVRQLRRRLARSGSRGARSRASAALERTARQLADELGGQTGSDDL